MQNARIIISRAGYSTIMDLVKLQKSALLVPTPGQTEQEYLAAFLKERSFFYSVGQDELNLTEDIQNVKDYVPPDYKERDLLSAKIRKLAISLEDGISSNQGCYS